MVSKGIEIVAPRIVEPLKLIPPRLDVPLKSALVKFAPLKLVLKMKYQLMKYSSY